MQSTAKLKLTMISAANLRGCFLTRMPSDFHFFSNPGSSIIIHKISGNLVVSDENEFNKLPAI